MVGSSLVGCYTLQPTSGAAPSVGENVAFDVNDAGRMLQNVAISLGRQ